ncbi:MAG: hypothetical protein AAF412_02930 [Pseudomonadota bacterium]
MTITILSLLLSLGTTILAQSYEVTNDKRVEAGAQARAAARIGEIRGTLSHDDVPVILMPGPNKKNSDKVSQIYELQSPVWMRSNPHENAQQQIAMPEPEFGTDSISTGSIVPEAAKEPRERVIWDIFDSDGNLVKNDGYW